MMNMMMQATTKLADLDPNSLEEMEEYVGRSGSPDFNRPLELDGSAYDLTVSSNNAIPQDQSQRGDA